MRSIRKPNVPLPTLVRIKNEYDITKAPKNGGPPEGEWNNPDVRGALYAISGRVCAYCQRRATDGRGDVEHFRPKSIYRWLQYDFDNYYVSCSMCNRQRKRSDFPIEHGAKRMTQANGIRIKDEKRMLLDPGADPVEEWVTVDFRDPLCSVKPIDGISELGVVRAKKTIRFFRLNMKKEVRTDRRDKINEALELIDRATEQDDTALNRLRRMASGYKPHGTAIRQIISDIAPGLQLPSLEEELRWYVDELLQSIAEGAFILDDEPSMSKAEQDDIKKSLDEDYWSLTVLLRDPPGTPPVDIRSWIEEDYLKTIEDRYLKKL